MAGLGPFYGVIGPESAVLRRSDGVDLVADVYRPDGRGRYPVLLMRQPYGRRIASTIVLAHPAWYAAHGYVVVIQDVRGRGDSGGRFRVLEDDLADGAETLAWGADLPHTDGQVATYGFSYQAITQLLALAGAGMAGTKRPDAMALIMGAWHLRDDWVFEGGAFRLSLNQYWACQMGADQARLAGDFEAFHALQQAAEHGCHSGPVPGVPQVLREFSDHHHYFDWLADDPEHWNSISPARLLAGDALDVPVLHVGGWQDFMLEGTWASYRAFATAKKARQQLLIGPWRHLPWGQQSGALDLGFGAGAGIDTELLGFFDWHLKGIGENGPTVRLFDAGLSSWRSFHSVPEGPVLTLHLASEGRAAPTTTDGRLTSDALIGQDDVLVHDPWRAAPYIGLHLGTPGGYADRRVVDDRSDVAVYTGEALERPLELIGSGKACLDVSCDRVSHDLHCWLSAVMPDGRAVAVTGGSLRVPDASSPGIRCVHFRPSCFTFPKSSRLRLSIQAAASPAFAVNPGTGESSEMAAQSDALVTTLHIHHDGSRRSTLRLPSGSFVGG